VLLLEMGHRGDRGVWPDRGDWVARAVRAQSPDQSGIGGDGRFRAKACGAKLSAAEKLGAAELRNSGAAGAAGAAIAALAFLVVIAG